MVLPLLAQLGLPFLVKSVSEGLSKIDHPLAHGAVAALEQMDEALTQGKISPEAVKEANRHIEKMTEIESAEYVSMQSEINQSLRAEVASLDPYVRRMRPTFGYLVAITWGAQMLALAYVIVFDTQNAGIVINAMQSLGTIWGIGLSVLGIYVFKRSEEKKSLPTHINYDKK
jgi:hypothetical protein